MSLKSTVLTYDRPAPRYTSYPPATQFQPVAEPLVRERALREVPESARISLYLHIPFCHQLCYYCGCFTSVTQKVERIERYLQAMGNELRLVSAQLPSGVRIAHMHFGGGSPSMLSADQFRELTKTIRQYFTFAEEVEIALELDPRQASEAKVAAYAQAGVNRISLGVQDFDKKVLAAVNREQGVGLTWQAVEWCREYNIAAVNFDLIYGLPHQSVESIVHTMEMATAMKPSRVAFFGYAHVPWMKKHMKAMDMAALPDASRRYDLFKAGSMTLQNSGYCPVGIDHFVTRDDAMYQALNQHKLRRNFQGYTTDALPVLIGIGASAISRLPKGYLQNKADIADYESRLGAGKFSAMRGWKLSDDEMLHAAIIESLMCYFEVDMEFFVSRLAQRHFSIARERLAPLIAEGMVVWEKNMLRILHEPQLLARLVASAFDQYTPWQEDNLEGIPLRHARAV